MTFQNIMGNEKVKRFLSHMLSSGGFPNVLLFQGIAGIGKSLFAKEVAKHLLYPQAPSLSAIERIEKNSHPDFHLLLPEGKSEMHSMESLQKMIQEASLPPFEAKAKVFLIEEAHRMLSSSANALLKILEEASSENYFLLLSSRPELLLPTVVSRCFSLSFFPLTEEEITSFILTHWQKTQEEAKRIAIASQGSLAMAKTWVFSSFFEEKKQSLLDMLFERDCLSCAELSMRLSAFEKLFQKEEEKDAENILSPKQEVEFLFSHILWWYRDLHSLKRGEKPFFFMDIQEKLKRQDFERLPSLERVHELMEEALFAFERNMKFTSCLENFFFRLLPH